MHKNIVHVKNITLRNQIYEFLSLINIQKICLYKKCYQNKEIIDRPQTVSNHPINIKTNYYTDFYIFHTTSLVTIRLLLLTIIALSCYYIKNWLKQKNILTY